MPEAERPDEWEICETRCPAEDPARQETIFSLANGYLGLRGDLEETDEPDPACHSGTYINGFYESEPITYGESAYGYARNSQTILNLPNGKRIRLEVEGEPLDLRKGHVEAYRCALSMREGLLRRELTWTSPGGKTVRVLTERLVSLTRRHIAAIRYAVTPLNFSGSVRLTAELDGSVHNRSGGDDPRVGSGAQQGAMRTLRAQAAPDFSSLTRRTNHSGLTVCCGLSARLEAPAAAAAACAQNGDVLRTDFRTALNRAESATLSVFLCYLDSRGEAESGQAGADLTAQCREELREAARAGFGALRAEQRGVLDGFWQHADIEIGGDAALQRNVRYGMFQLLQSAGRDGRTNVSSKGLSGEGYEGHYFWDTEMYILPFFVYTAPQIARKLLEYRYNTLEQARARAKELHHKGALFPWRTINGEECSAYFPAGTAQYHIDADIAHAVCLYVEAAKDEAFLVDCGAEILFETARFWVDLGHFNPHRGGAFCINCVTGPDEYNALVNNNCYTNLMAADNLRHALAAAALLKARYPRQYRDLAGRLGLSEDEFVLWREASDKMYVPYDEELQIHLQDDSFLDRKPWDFEGTPREAYPLLLHYHPLEIYRHNVCKQADLILALFVLPELFTPEQAGRDYAFYEKITTHDSSLSPSAFCVAACMVGRYEDAMRYFEATAQLDLADRNGNTADGLHTACMAGTWMGIVYGFGGMRLRDGELHFAPHLPERWESFSFRVTVGGCLLDVRAGRGQTQYTLLEGDALTVWHGGERLMLDAGHPTRTGGAPL